MNTPVYASEDKYYLPERIFFRNLFNCCQCRKEDFLEKIKAVMEQDIEKSIESLLKDIEFAEGLDETTTGSKRHLLSTDFLNYVKKESKKSNGRASNYSLTNYYRRISSAASNACLDSDALSYKPTKIAEDRKVLELFQTLYQDAEPLSLRELNRILEPTGKILLDQGTEMHTYTNNQDTVVVFTILKVIPDIFIHAERSRLSLLTSKNWKDVVCKYQAEKGFPSGVMEIDTSTKADFENYMCSCFDKLKEIAKLPQNDQEVDNIGELLLKMYDRIVTEHKKGKIHGLPDQHTKYRKCSKYSSGETNVTQVADDELFQYDGFVSIHITNLLEWINIAHDDNCEFMEYIDRLIDKNRDHILRQLNKTFTLDELRKFQKDSESGNSLFLWQGNEHLLRLLIHAMHDEAVVCNNMQMGG